MDEITIHFKNGEGFSINYSNIENKEPWIIIKNSNEMECYIKIDEILYYTKRMKM